MYWFKHPTDSRRDPDLVSARDKFGDKAVVIFWDLLEIYGREFNGLDEEDFLWVTKPFLTRELRRKWTTTHLVLSYYEKLGRLQVIVNENQVGIKIPKFITMASNWTKRKKPKPTEVPTVVPTAIEVEVEVEEKKELRVQEKEQEKPPPAKSTVKIEDPKLREEVIERCKKLKNRENGSFPRAFGFVNAMLKKNHRPDCIFYALGALETNPDLSSPWPYAEKISLLQTQKLNEAESIAEHRKTMEDSAKRW